MHRHKRFFDGDVRALALMVAILVPSAAAAQKAEADLQPTAQVERADRIIRVAKFRGRFVGFTFGDYLHATFVGKHGKEKSFFVLTQGIDYFLAQYRGQDVQVTYEVVEQFIPEAGQRVRLDRIVDAQAGAQRYSLWWIEMKRMIPPEEIERRYQPLVEKAML
jgi:hypothetical protein